MTHQQPTILYQMRSQLSNDVIHVPVQINASDICLVFLPQPRSMHISWTFQTEEVEK